MKGHPAGLRVAVLDEEGRELVGLVAVDPIADHPGWYAIDVHDERPPRSRFTTELEHDQLDGPWFLLVKALDYVSAMTGAGRPPDPDPEGGPG